MRGRETQQATRIARGRTAAGAAELKEILAVREALVSLKRKNKTEAWGGRLKKMPKLVTGLFTNFARGESAEASDSDSETTPVKSNQSNERPSEVPRGYTRAQQSAPTRAYAQPSKAGSLYLVKLRHADQNYLKVVTRCESYEMEVVQKWSLPSDEIARKIEEAILKEFGDFRGAAPEDMDGYRESFAFQLESQLKAAVEAMVVKHASKPGSTKALVQQFL